MINNEKLIINGANSNTNSLCQSESSSSTNFAIAVALYKTVQSHEVRTSLNLMTLFRCYLLALIQDIHIIIYSNNYPEIKSLEF